ncbi:MAG: alpha/beta hydrolase [Candidatus Competibacterales bacterium]|nr:alpha/beta hydrolase [Candidatus Competibacterales bacterium]
MPMRPEEVLGLNAHGFHRIRYTEWGDRANPRVLICVHGLTRNGRDFDALAETLEPDYRVLCPDVVGRGASDWLTDKSAYHYPQYLADMAVLIARSGARQLDWIGTSMGGLLGMLLAAQPQTPIRRLVINDVGPFIPRAALERIAAYVGQPVSFDSLEALEAELRSVAAPFGPLTDAQWRHLAAHGARRREDGRYVFNYDPGIAQAFGDALEDIDLWAVWERIECPVLVLRGAESDLLRHEDALAMTRRGPSAELVEFPGIGHAPVLMTSEQIEPIRRWLLTE